MDVFEKLQILTDAAKYDAACTSSGIDKRAARGGIGNATACGICHSFSGDGRCISLLKVLIDNPVDFVAYWNESSESFYTLFKKSLAPIIRGKISRRFYKCKQTSQRGSRKNATTSQHLWC